MAYTIFAPEVKAIEKLRAKHKAMPQITLARKISDGERGFRGGREVALDLRPFLSTYSVIRRYDAKIKVA